VYEASERRIEQGRVFYYNQQGWVSDTTEYNNLAEVPDPYFTYRVSAGRSAPVLRAPSSAAEDAGRTLQAGECFDPCNTKVLTAVGVIIATVAELHR
jgi:hypothetical protein